MLSERVLLFRPLGKTLLHAEVRPKSGSDTSSVNAPGDITFTVPAHWHNKVAADGGKYFVKRGTLVVVERANRSIRCVGLVDDLNPGENGLEVSAGGFSMVIPQSGPWEGHQGSYVSKDALSLYRDVVAQSQSYSNSNLGIRVIGDERSGGSVGYPGSQRWQDAERAVRRYKPDLDRWEGRLVARERTLSQRQEAMFRAAGLKRVGDVTQTEDGSSPPEDPGYKADSTLWIREDAGIRGRAFRWRDGQGWVSQSQADEAVRSWRGYLSTVEEARAEVERLQYLIEPYQEALDELEHEAREEYSLYFWQNHELDSVIEDLTNLGPFQYRERAAWDGDDLDLMLEVGAPYVGVRRDELHLEFGVNVQAVPDLEYGDVYTGVTLFGAGEGSDVLSAQRSWAVEHVVRNIFVDTDKDAHTKALTDTRANKLAQDLQAGAGLKIKGLVVHHSKKLVPEGSFLAGDVLPVTGRLPDGTKITQWLRVTDATHEWGSRHTSLEVEAA